MAEIELMAEPARADLVVFSTFSAAARSTRPRDPRSPRRARHAALLHGRERAPGLRACDFALSFCRELVDPRHLRVPNFVGTQRLHGYRARRAAATRRPIRAAVRRAKTRFCAYVQGNRVPLREDFVRGSRATSRVDCAGPSLNNTGFVVDRAEKYALYRESKFAVTFENEAAVGYTTEKLPDALLEHCVPIYWGDPDGAPRLRPARASSTCATSPRPTPWSSASPSSTGRRGLRARARRAALPAASSAARRPAVLRAFFARVAQAARRARRATPAAR